MPATFSLLVILYIGTEYIGAFRTFSRWEISRQVLSGSCAAFFFATRRKLRRSERQLKRGALEKRIRMGHTSVGSQYQVMHDLFLEYR